MKEKGGLKKLYWFQVGGWIALIYLTLPIVRPISDYLRARLPLGNILDAVILLIIAGAVLIFISRHRIRFLSTYLLLAAIIVCYLASLARISYPDEKAHFIQYGILSALMFRAVCLHCPPAEAYLLSLGLSSLVGWGDEVIQYYLPGRYYDFNDVLLNSFSALLGLTIVFTLNRERRLV